jgi:MFS family permease
MVFFALTTTALWQAFVVMGLLGLGIGYTFAAMPSLIVGAIPRSETGSAMGFYQVSRYLGSALGSGLCVTLLRAFAHGGQPTLESYRATALVAGGLAVVAAIIGWVLPGRPTSPEGVPEGDRASSEGTAGMALLEEPA